MSGDGSGAEAPVKFAGILLAPGVRKRHMRAFLAINFLMMIANGGLVALAPWILTNLVHVEPGSTGTVTGALLILHEIILVALLAPFGVLADRIGRRTGLGLGLLLCSIAVPALSFAHDLPTLIAARCMLSVGLAAVFAFSTVVLADYPLDGSRGKATGLQQVATAVSIAFTMGLLMRIPERLVAAFPALANDQVSLAHIWFSVIGGFVFLAVPLTLLLRKEWPGSSKAKVERKSLLASARDVWALTKREPLIALSMAGCFVQSGDAALGQGFVMLWLNNHAANVLKMSPAAAAMASGLMLLSAVVAMFIAAPIVGALVDRIAPAKIIAAGMAVSLVAMITFSFVEDPFGLLFRGCLICTMVGQMVAGIASTALAAAKAPESMRGSVTGVFRAAGAVGMLSFTIIGGIMFDAHGPAAPFLVLSFVNLFVGVAAVVLHVRTHAPRVAAPAMA